MRSASRTDQGLVRENNEDFILVDEEHGIFILADGMGGGPAGEVASSLAATAAHESLLSQLEGQEVTLRSLAEALASAHSAVAKRALREPSKYGMGTTLEIVVVRGARAITCHVGDSRIYHYHLHQDLLRQVTTDDNYAAMVAEVGDIPDEEIPPAYKHILTQAVGISEQLVPELRSLDLKPGDLLLICSDGLTGAVGDGEIKAVIGWESELSGITDALVTAANEKGGADNVSVIVVEALPAVAAETLPMPLPD